MLWHPLWYFTLSAGAIINRRNMGFLTLQSGGYLLLQSGGKIKLNNFLND